MARLPDILAGPIVRRSTPEEVNVWLATSLPLSNPVLALVDTDSGEPLDAEPLSRSVRLGQNLYVHMLTARPHDGLLPQGTPIGYDIRLGELGLADWLNLASVVLPGFGLPTFVLQPFGIGRLHALYGSCRKIHGPAPDMMQAAAHVMKKQPVGRPEALFLGGDQIYADDVDEKLIVHINKLAYDLMGRQEFVKGLPPAAHAPQIDRSKFLKRAAFTSGHMPHHLLTFGEYAATYLFAWSPEHWRRTVIAGGLNPALPATDATRGAMAARLVLANTVTYMTFDDHEITDDWFLNHRWRAKALTHEATERIILNGMCAYWAFQGWGNDPGAYDDEFLKVMESYALDGSDKSNAIEKLLVLGPGWSYLAPTSPPALVLDTRTGRQMSEAFADEGPPAKPPQTSYAHLKYGIETPDMSTRDINAPRLLGAGERARVRRLLKGAGSPVIVVAPAPVFGFRPIEEVQAFVGGFSPEAGDLESWAANPRNAVDFVKMLAEEGIEEAIVLSGDVHYAFELAVAVTLGSDTFHIAQFCSSAMKNRPTKGQLVGSKVLRQAGLRKYAIAWWAFGSDDGRIIRRWAYPSRLYNKTKQEHGDPTFIIAEYLNDRDGGGVVIKNNVGELIIDGTEIRHRFWLPTSSSAFGPTDFTVWQPKAWPAARVEP